MTRQDSRNAYPFHNPRANVPCCNRRRTPEPLYFPWGLIAWALVILACILTIAKAIF